MVGVRGSGKYRFCIDSLRTLSSRRLALVLFPFPLGICGDDSGDCRIRTGACRIEKKGGILSSACMDKWII